MTLSLSAHLQVARDVLSRRFHDEIVVLDLIHGEYFSLDEVGARIWDGLAEGCSLAEVVNVLALEYDADVARLSVDVVALAEELVERRLLLEVDVK